MIIMCLDSTHKPVNVINMAHCKTKQCIKSPLIKRKRKSLTNVSIDCVAIMYCINN